MPSSTSASPRDGLSAPCIPFLCFPTERSNPPFPQTLCPVRQMRPISPKYGVRSDANATYILVNLEALPPVTLLTRNEASSVLSSFNCSSRSCLFLIC